jgi:hypothetical protein
MDVKVSHRISEWTYEELLKTRERNGLPPISIEEADALLSEQHPALSGES